MVTTQPTDPARPGEPTLTEASEALLTLAVYSDVPTWFVDKLHDILPNIEAEARQAPPIARQRKPDEALAVMERFFGSVPGVPCACGHLVSMHRDDGPCQVCDCQPASEPDALRTLLAQAIHEGRESVAKHIGGCIHIDRDGVEWELCGADADLYLATPSGARLLARSKSSDQVEALAPESDATPMGSRDWPPFARWWQAEAYRLAERVEAAEERVEALASLLREARDLDNSHRGTVSMWHDPLCGMCLGCRVQAALAPVQPASTDGGVG